MKGNTSHTSQSLHSRMLATCNACRAHNRVYTVQTSESPYPGSTPGLNPWFSSITMFYGLYPHTTSRAALSAQTVRLSDSQFRRGPPALRPLTTPSKGRTPLPSNSPRSTQVTLNFASRRTQVAGDGSVSPTYSQHAGRTYTPSDQCVRRCVIPLRCSLP